MLNNFILKQFLRKQSALTHSQKCSIFSQFGIGTDEATFERHGRIFKNKNYSNPDIPLPRNPEIDKYTETNFINFEVESKNQNKLKLYTYRLKAQNIEKPKGLIYMYHGMHSQAQTSGHIARAYSEKGFEVLSFDHRGHGQSEGKRGWVENLESHLNDSLQFVKLTRELYHEDTPKFISGLSMGGMTTYLLTKRYPHIFRGAILYAPAIKAIHNPLDQKISKILNQYIPSTPVMPPNIYSSNRIKEFCQILTQEEYSGRKWFLKPGTADSLFTGMKECTESFSQYKVPFLIIQGGIDKLVDPLGAKNLLFKSPSKDKQMIWYDDMWHDIWHEPEITEIIPQAVQWVEDRI